MLQWLIVSFAGAGLAGAVDERPAGVEVKLCVGVRVGAGVNLDAVGARTRLCTGKVEED